MICSSCQANNPDQAKFCMQCGAAQANTCPPCSTELPTEARFCFGCGHQIGEASTLPAVASTPVAPPETRTYHRVCLGETGAVYSA